LNELKLKNGSVRSGSPETPKRGAGRASLSPASRRRLEFPATGRQLAPREGTLMLQERAESPQHMDCTVANVDGGSGMRLVPAGTLKLRNPGQWLVEDILPAGALAVVYGHNGTGKSFLALDLCFHIAQGSDWNGRATCKGSAVYVAGEAGNGLSNRVKAWESHHNRRVRGLFCA
jgi:hypothetical protein